MSLPYTIAAGQDIEAAPVQGNFENLDARLVSIENVIDNVTTDTALYDNGVFPGGLVASQVGTTLVYTSGQLIVNHISYVKTGLVVDFAGKASDTYYVECDSTGDVDIYTSSSTARTNLDTVDWNGSSFVTVDQDERNVLVAYQEIVDARGTYGTLEDRLDDLLVAIGLSGGQTLAGGTGASENLTIQSTAHATKGTVQIKQLTTEHKVLSLSTTPLTLSAIHSTVVCDCSGGTITITLPEAADNLGREYCIFVDAYTSGEIVTVNCAGSDTFDGSSTSADLTLDSFMVLRAVSADRWLVTSENGVSYS